MATEKEDPQKIWDELAAEREAEKSPSTDEVKTEAKTDEETEAAIEAEDKTTEVEAKSEETPAKQETKEEDPFAGLPPAVRERLQRLEAVEAQLAELPKLQQQVKTAEGRVAAMQREMDVAKHAAKSVGDAPTAAQIAAAKGDTKKWDALKEDFPEWADATEQFVKAQIAGLTPQQTQGLTPEQVQQLVEQRVTAVRDEAMKAVEEARVDGKYENWRDEVKTAEFATWFEAQKPDIKALAQSPKGRDAIRLMDLYHGAKSSSAEQVAQSRANKLAAAVSTKPTPAASANKTVDQMSPAELWEYERKRAAKKAAARGLTY